jgi:hypothetical protein
VLGRVRRSALARWAYLAKPLYENPIIGTSTDVRAAIGSRVRLPFVIGYSVRHRHCASSNEVVEARNHHVANIDFAGSFDIAFNVTIATDLFLADFIATHAGLSKIVAVVLKRENIGCCDDVRSKLRRR